MQGRKDSISQQKNNLLKIDFKEVVFYAFLRSCSENWSCATLPLLGAVNVCFRYTFPHRNIQRFRL